jgi:hypothetical protein
MAGSDGTGGDREDIVIGEVRNENGKHGEVQSEDGADPLWDNRRLKQYIHEQDSLYIVVNNRDRRCRRDAILRLC